MSFSQIVKDELIDLKRTQTEMEIVVLAMLAVGSADGCFTSGSKKVSSFLQDAVRYVYHKTASGSRVNNLYAISIKDVKRTYGQFKNSILTNKQSCSLFLSGAFLARGSINNPDKGTYHFEISCVDKEAAMFIQRVINALNYDGMDFNAKLVKRRNKLIVYIKEMSKILDLLRLMEASKVAFKYEEISMIRQIKNEEKRKVNWEIANDHKQMMASDNQLTVINYLYLNYPLEKLEQTLLLIMKIRQENPLLSIRRISDFIKKNYDFTVSRTWVARRFARLEEIAKNHKKGVETL